MRQSLWTTKWHSWISNASENVKKVENTRRRQQYDNPITKKAFDDAVHYCNNLAHNNNTEMRFVSSEANVLMSNSAYLSVINNALINEESGFMRLISKMVKKVPLLISRYECLKIKPRS